MTAISACNFVLSIDGRELGARAISAPSLVARRERVGEAAAAPLTIHRAVDGNRLLFEWGRAASLGKEDRRTVEIALLAGPSGPRVFIWRLVDAEPLRWAGPSLDATVDTVAEEQIEIVARTIEWLR